MGLLDELPPDMLEDAVELVRTSPDLQEYLQLLDESAYSTFIPRPDRPELFDQQAGFCYSKDLVSFLVGGNASGCLGAEQAVYDPVAGKARVVSEIDGPFNVLALDQSTGRMKVAEASQPIVYGTADLYEVTLSNGKRFVSTLAHRVLDVLDDYVPVGMLPTDHRLQSGLPSTWNMSLSQLPRVVRVRFLRRDQYWDFSVKEHKNYLLAGIVHSNTTEACAHKLAKFVLQDQPPPRPDTPFWVITSTYDQCCGICWLEKLLGNGHIPSIEVDWPRTRWFREKDGWPFAIHLKPWPRDRKGGNGRNSWMLEFKSYEQGRTAFHAKSIGGFWFSEQFPWQLFVETLRGCRDYMYRGGQMCEFTPIDPELCYHLEKVMDDPPKGWGFYRANTDCNRVNLAEGWFDSFFGAVPDEMQETRRTGALATFEGVIFPTFNPAIHVVRGKTTFPVGVRHYRGVDWGASAEHPFTCVWGYVDAVGSWVIYEEYWSDSQARITLDHVVAIVEKSILWRWPGHWLGTGDREAESKIGPVWVPQQREVYRETYADPSRPGEINEFGNRGIPVSAAANDVYKGIDTVRTLLKIQPNDKPKIVIHERCVHLIEEIRKYRWKRGKKSLVSGGSILNPQVGQPIPLKRDDDTCFIAGTAVQLSDGSQKPIEQVKPGDQVLSHRGVATVLGAGLTGQSPVAALFFDDGRHIICTPSHRLGISGGGWAQAGACLGLRIDCLEESCFQNSALSRRDLGMSLSLSIMAGIPGGDIQMAERPAIAPIFGDSRGGMEPSGPFGFTSRYGKIIEDRFPPVGVSIIWTAIQEIITLKTLLLSILRSIRESTSPTLTRLVLKPPSGIAPKKAASGTRSTESSHGSRESPGLISVNIAAKSTAAERPDNFGSVATAAVTTRDCLPESTTRLVGALGVRSHSRSIVTQRRNAARSRVRPVCLGYIESLPLPRDVYNLATSDGTFFANGVLVSNCDALRYMLHTHEISKGLAPTKMSHREWAQQRKSIPMDLRSGGRGAGPQLERGRR